MHDVYGFKSNDVMVMMIEYDYDKVRSNGDMTKRWCNEKPIMN